MDYITKWSFDRIWKKGNTGCGFPDPVKLREGKITKQKKRFPPKNSNAPRNLRLLNVQFKTKQMVKHNENHNSFPADREKCISQCELKVTINNHQESLN